jgi:hypothetical protein
MPGVLKRFWRPETGIYLLIWLGLLVGGRSRLFRDPGTFWHTRAGELMLTTGHLLHEDPFSYTFAHERWIPFQWLGECVMALVHRLDGLDSLLLATVTLLAGLYTWVAHRLLRSGLHWSLTLVAILLVLAASASHFHVRPHLITIVLLGWTVARLVDFETGRIGLSQLFWLVPLYALWTNVHGGMLGGLATLGLAWVGWCLNGWLGAPTPLRTLRQQAAIAGLIAACGLTAFVNPYGEDLPRAWLAILRSPNVSRIIVEHAPLNPAHADGIVVLVLGAVYLAVLAGIGFRWPRVTWLLPLPWLFLACTGIRNAPLFAVTAAVALADLLPHTRWARWMARPGSDLFQFPKDDVAVWRPGLDWRPALVPIGLVVTALVLQLARVPAPIVGHGWHQLDPSYWPATDAPDDPMLLTLRQYQGKETPIFNDLTFGGFLIGYTPGYRVFIDDRCEVFGNARQLGRELLLRYDRVTNEEPEELKRMLAEFQPEARRALVRRGSPVDAHLRRSGSGWELKGESESAAFFIRPDEPPAVPGQGQGSAIDRSP